MPAVRMVIFSKDRPFQLDGCLRSFYTFCLDAHTVKPAVLVKLTDDYLIQYRRVAKDFPQVEFIPESAFAFDLTNWLANSDYTLFVVDDCVFWRQFRIADALRALGGDSDGIGFSLRLGRNIIRSYVESRPVRQPDFHEAFGCLWWDWPGADGDFGYPLEVSSSLYRTKEIWSLIQRAESPNYLESALALQASSDARLVLWSYPKSVAYCVPCNRVQDTHPNRAGTQTDLSPAALRSAYALGWRMDIKRLPEPISPHQEIAIPMTKGRAT